MTIDLRLGDCLDLMRPMPSSSVHLIATDPPYHRVKAEAWDRQWKTDGDYLSWIGELCSEWRRILKPNGSLYVFASPRMAARVECRVGESFNVLNSIVWNKGDGSGAEKGARGGLTRSFIYQTERIVFAEHFGADSHAKGEAGYSAKCDELRGFVFEPLRAYLDGERRRAGVDRCAIEEATGTQMFGHWFSRVQWAMPTVCHYETLRRLFNADGGEYLRREYEDLRREYEDLRREYEDLRREYEDLRRPFSVDSSVPYTDVWDFPTVPARTGKHPCAKPPALMEHIVRTSSRPGDLVLDCFMGNGTTGEACLNTGRDFIGIETHEPYYRNADRRLAAARVEAASRFHFA